MKSRSPLVYQRLKSIRKRNGQAIVDDKAMTVIPRYGKDTALSHHRGEKRMERWLRYG